MIDRPWKFIDTAIVGLTRYPFLNKWKGFNYLSPQLSWLLTGVAALGTILFLFSAVGRLVLLLLITSLVPYAFTYEIPGGFEWRFTMHAYPFYMIGAALFLTAAIGFILNRRAWQLISDRPLSKRTYALVSASTILIVVGGWLVLNELNFLRKKEAMRADEAILITSGARDYRFLGPGWFSTVRLEGQDVRISRGMQPVLKAPMKGNKEYNLILRLQPAFEKREVPAQVDVTVNEKLAGSFQIQQPVDSAYVVRLPAELTKDGVNRINLKLSDTESGSVALQYWKIQPIEAFQRGLKMYEQGEIDSAITYFQEALKQSGKRKSQIFYYLGRCYLMKGEAQKAINHFTQGLTLSVRNPEILEARAEAYILANQPDQAILDLTKVLKRRPTNENAKRLMENAKAMK
jgi:tetratricopeptide (TPR) repeat protein